MGRSSIATHARPTKGKQEACDRILAAMHGLAHIQAMARVHGIAVVALVAAGAAAWLLLARGSDDAPPPPAPTPAIRPQEAGDAAEAEMQRSGGVVAAPIAPSPATTPVSPVQDLNPQPEEAVQPNLRIEVRDQRTGQPVAGFAWRWQDASGSAKGMETGGSTALSLTAGSSGELLVESAGLEPATRRLELPKVGENPLLVDLVLSPVVAAAGAGLVVLDTMLAPVTGIRVTLLREDRFTKVWSRRAKAADGVYRLPTMEPGTYWVRVAAVDEQGMPLTLVPVERMVRVTGVTPLEESIRMQPGCLLSLDVLAADGNPFDPKQCGRVGLRFLDAAGAQINVDWRSGSGAEAVVAADQVPAVGRIHAETAVPAGACTIVVRGPGDAETPFQLVLERGTDHEVLRTNHRVR